MAPVMACSRDDARSEQHDLAWENVGGGVESAVLEVPLDYDEPDGDTVRMPVMRRRAAEPGTRVGALLVNPGGPGFGGTGYVRAAETLFAPELLERFDIVSWDPRGTGASEPAIDCVDDRDAGVEELDATPVSAAERDTRRNAARRFASACAERTGELLRYVGTVSVARDIDAIRDALGEEQISYFGFSYGSELGATWATMFPDTVRAAVLDGAIDLEADWSERTVQQAEGFEASLTAFLDDCSANADCAFHSNGNAAGAFDQLMADLEARPLRPAPDRPAVTHHVALGAARQALYAEGFWDQLARALAAARDGDGAGLLMLWDASQQRQADGTWSDTLEAFEVITCMDQAERPNAAEADALAEAVLAAAPRIGPVFAYEEVCSFLPGSDEPRPPISASETKRILVIGTTGDPATPLAGTRAAAEQLGAAGLVVVGANQHTGYRTNACVDDAVSAFLVDLAAAQELLC